MKKLAIIVLGIIALLITVASYRSYRNRTDRELDHRRAMLAERQTGSRQRTAAEQEAERLAAMLAEQEAAAAAKQAEELRSKEAAEKERRAAAEAEVLRLHAELERLRRESEAMIEQTKNLTASRPNEFAAVDAARQEALDRLRALEVEKTEIADRQAAHAAALEEQLAKEKAAQERVRRYRSAQRR